MNMFSSSEIIVAIARFFPAVLTGDGVGGGVISWLNKFKLEGKVNAYRIEWLMHPRCQNHELQWPSSCWQPWHFSCDCDRLHPHRFLEQHQTPSRHSSCRHYQSQHINQQYTSNDFFKKKKQCTGHRTRMQQPQSRHRCQWRWLEWGLYRNYCNKALKTDAIGDDAT